MGVFLTKALIHPPPLITPKGPTLNAITLGSEFQHRNLRGHGHSNRSRRGTTAIAKRWRDTQNGAAAETQTRTTSSDPLGEEEPGAMKAAHCSGRQGWKGHLQPAGGAQVQILSQT